ncbi:hypothetical protein [Streptomyces sp. NPDC048419]
MPTADSAQVAGLHTAAFTVRTDGAVKQPEASTTTSADLDKFAHTH